MILDPDSRPEDILHHASIALAQATATPHRRVQFFRPSLQRDLFHRATLQQHLAKALDGETEDAGTLDVYFQPIVNSATFQLWGFEALARWKHPQHGDIPPARFIPLAEESGLIHRLGEFVLEKACLYAGIWNAQQTIHVNVNLSPHQLTAPNLVEHIREVLDAAQVPPQRIILEITESSLMLNPRLAVNTLRRLRQLGLGIAIDDFGTGYSSLAYLHQLPITALKIDRSFVASIHNPETQSLVQTILSLAFALGVSVTAEGVESPDQALLLSQLQTHTLQGFLFAHPLPADQASDLLRTGSVLRPTT